MDEIQAAVLQVKLTRLTQENKKREKIATNYTKQLLDLPIKFQKVNPATKSANHLFVILTKERDKLKKHLLSKQIDSDIHYPYPVYRQKAFSKFSNGPLKVTDDIQGKILSLPIFPHLKEEDQNKIIFEIRNFFKTHR